MSVNIRGHQFYSEAEVSAMVPSGTIDSQWETYDLTLKNGFTVGWKLNKFHVNKITGLVTGEVGIQGMGSATSLNYGSNANLGVHSGMDIKYTGAFEYATADASASAAQKGSLQMLNTSISTTGEFTLQGTPSSPQSGLSTFLECHAYIGSKYGKITTTDIKPPVYLPEGAFYDINTADLITGKAWLKVKLTGMSGYNSSSYITFYKNLWSGEIIMQYSLYPNIAGTTPAIQIPERMRMFKRSDGVTCHSFFNCRYVDGLSTDSDVSSRQRTHMYLQNDNYLRISSGGTWITGSQFYQGNPEVRPHNVEQETVALWIPEASTKIPSANNTKWPGSFNPSFVDVSNYWVSGYSSRTANYPSWVTTNLRTGMVYFYFDVNTTGAALPDPLTKTTWNTDYVPSYRYNTTSGTSQQLYCAGANYVSTSDPVAPGISSYTCNLYINTGKSLGVVATNTDIANSCLWRYGTPGPFKAVSGNLACFTGFYLSNSNHNIVQ